MGTNQLDSPHVDAAQKKMNFYSAWFCPYAQRAWITLEYHNIPYQYIESLTVEADQNNGDHGYQKNPRLLEVNPRGLVPTLEFVPGTFSEMEDAGYKIQNVNDVSVLSESMVCVQFLNSISTKKDEKDLIPRKSLLSDAKILNEKVCSVFYEILMKASREDQREAFHNFASNISEFMDEVVEGGYYKSDLPTIADFTVIPWFLRFPVLAHYRPMFSLEDFMSSTSYKRLVAYLDRIKKLPAVKNTLWKDEQDLLQQYTRYADGTAESQVGLAVRNGQKAHNA